MVQFTNDDLHEADALMRAIERELPGIVTTSGSSDWFLFYDPDGVTDPAKRFPFATIVTGDRYDAASHLDRDQRTYRVNIGIDRAAYKQLFGSAPRQPAGYDVIDSGFDYTDIDTVLPHPLYAPLHWVCVVNPAERTRGQLAELLEGAHAQARRQYDNQHPG